MKFFVSIWLLLSSLSVVAQQGSSSLKLAVTELDNALVAKDTIVLKRILSDQVTYGHSNGWVETKKEVIADLYNGKLTYKNISTNVLTVNIDNGIAWVRADIEVDVVYEATPLQMKLGVLQVWKRENERWVLFARQSVKK